MKAEFVLQKIRFDPRGPVPPGALDGRTSHRPWLIAEETLAYRELAPAASAEDTASVLHIAWITGGTTSERQELGRNWLRRSSELGPVAAVVGQDGEATVEWMPGWMVVQSPNDQKPELAAALIDFAFLEGALRRLESELAGCEAGAEADVSRAYDIQFRDRQHWRRLTELAAASARLRLAFVRIRPALQQGAPGLPPRGKRVASRLRRQARIPSRLDGFCERLEACEDLYEGATDRVADYRWYVGGHLLEVAIVVLLLAEVVLMALELHFRLAGRLPN